MEEISKFLETLEQIRAKDRRYALEAYSFVMATLHGLLDRLGEARHVSGAELSHQVRDYAIDQFGPLARSVLEQWGLRTTADIGEIVFNMVEAGLLRKTPEDRKEDFANVYDFVQAFEQNYPYLQHPPL